MSVVPGADGWPVGWEHRVGSNVRRFERDPVGNDAPILHLKLFNPTDEWGEDLTFFAPPADALPTSNRAEMAALILPHAATRPWAPAHLRAAREASGDVSISWVRCARIGGDTWGAGEPPLGFPSESYVLEILDAGDPIRSETTSVPNFTYSAAAQTADFGSLPGSLHIRVAQIGESGATGLNIELTITL